MFDDEKTPVQLHAKPAPVVCPPLARPMNPLAALGLRKATPAGPAPLSDPFPAEEAPTPALSQIQHELARLQRLYVRAPLEARKLIMALAFQLSEDGSGKGRTT